MKMLKYFTFSVLLILFVLSISACSSKPVIYKEVKIPVKCDVPKRERPKFDEKLADAHSLEGLVYMVEEVYPAIFQYLEGIERDLAYCRGETK